MLVSKTAFCDRVEYSSTVAILLQQTRYLTAYLLLLLHFELESAKYYRSEYYFFPCPTKKPISPDAIALTILATHFLSSADPVANI